MEWRQGFDQFCTELGGLSYSALIGAVERADAEATRSMTGRRRGAPAARASGAQVFVDRAGRLLFWLRHAKLPDGYTSADLSIYRTLAAKLISRGELNPEVLAHLGEFP